MKTLPLIGAILKSFIRNKKSIFLLIVAPLILIMVIFLSFGTSGLQKIPVGVIGKTNTFDISDYEDSFLSFLKVQDYSSKRACLENMKSEGIYMCIEIIEGESTVVNIYYDNTREPVIWEVIERIKSSVDVAQKEQTRHMAEEFLEKFKVTNSKVGTFRENLNSVSKDLDIYIIQIDNSITELASTKTSLSNTIISMDQDIADAEETKDDLKNQRDILYDDSVDYMNDADTSLNQITNLSYQNYLLVQQAKTENNNLRNKINNYNSISNNYFYSFDSKISNYRYASSQGKQMIYKIDQGITKLRQTQSDLNSYKQELLGTDGEISNIVSEFRILEDLDPETLVNPIVIRSEPTYIPKVNSNIVNDIQEMNVTEQAKTINQGINMISLQTIFPTMLFLIILFLSLLISTFICLGEVNGVANPRKSLVKNIFFPELFAIFTSSAIITIIPTTLLMIMGEYVFQIEIFKNFFSIGLVLFLVISIFTLVGMILAYGFRQESTTLLVTTFIIVLMIFFSGFVFPTERMSDAAFQLSMNSPSKIGIISFNKIAFYGQPLSNIQEQIFSLIVWILFLSALVATIKKVRD